jgi:hypothetical protein
VNTIKIKQPKLTIFLTMVFLCSLPMIPRTVYAADTEVEEVDEFEEIETPAAEENAALSEMENSVLSGAPIVDDPDVESKQAKKDADVAEKQLAEAQKRLNEMKLYKASLAQKTKLEVQEAEKRKQTAEQERAALDAQRKKVEQEVAEIQRQQQKLEAIERTARLKAERARIQLAAAKEKRAMKRKATTKASPAIKSRKTIDPAKKSAAQQARI